MVAFIPAFDASFFVAAPFNASTYLAVVEVTEVTHVGFTEIASPSNCITILIVSLSRFKVAYRSIYIINRRLYLYLMIKL